MVTGNYCTAPTYAVWYPLINLGPKLIVSYAMPCFKSSKSTSWDWEYCNNGLSFFAGPESGWGRIELLGACEKAGDVRHLSPSRQGEAGTSAFQVFWIHLLFVWFGSPLCWTYVTVALSKKDQNLGALGAPRLTLHTGQIAKLTLILVYIRLIFKPNCLEFFIVKKQCPEEWFNMSGRFLSSWSLL